MDDFRQVGNALDGARRLGMIGDKLHGVQLVDPSCNMAADGCEIGGMDAPADTNEGTGAHSPGQFAAPLGGGQTRRVRLVVIRGGRTGSHAAAYRANPRPAVRLRLVTLDGEHVHSRTTSSMSGS